ncbi:glutathione S-transferase N-terminal domain-containing protein [Terasakiella sp. SH-1]|uniref:glutathione S-transferase family protein n=1 Tax=Terasakiella sp. SH-1 TaxID=2560057 RepID=UPI0010741599|nr:glutathione S-transferase N-terminal domain-containing protein [Terasakiella sp. SH-1]
MIKLISFTICPFVQRIAALLEGAGVPYETTFIQLSDKPQWFLDISPHGQVPLLITEDETILFESDAIADYVADTYLTTASPEARALEKAWASLAVKNYLVQCSTMSSKNQSSFETHHEKLRAAFEKMEQALRTNQTTAKTDISLLSSAWLVLLHRADIIQRKTCFDMLENLPLLQDWQRKLLTQEWTEKSVPPDFEERFSHFYLAEERYLIHGQEDCDQAPKKPLSCCE